MNRFTFQERFQYQSIQFDNITVDTTDSFIRGKSSMYAK